MIVSDKKTTPVVLIAWVVAALSVGYMLPWAIAETRGNGQWPSTTTGNHHAGLQELQEGRRQGGQRLIDGDAGPSWSAWQNEDAALDDSGSCRAPMPWPMLVTRGVRVLERA